MEQLFATGLGSDILSHDVRLRQRLCNARLVQYLSGQSYFARELTDSEAVSEYIQFTRINLYLVITYRYLLIGTCELKSIHYPL